MSIHDVAIRTLDGRQRSLADFAGKAVLFVNVASKCGLTPQYAALEQLQKTYGDRGLTVVGVPCNQFRGQEPGTPEDIAEFCSGTYGVTFPLMEKVDVNGPHRHPLYAALVGTPDAEGYRGDIRWNFEKFLVSPEGVVIDRFPPQVTPDAPEVVAAIEAQLPG